MRSSQWFVFSIFFVFISILFVQLDATWNCNFSDFSPLNKGDIFECINSEILDPFIWLLFPLSVVFTINGFIELFFEKKNKK